MWRRMKVALPGELLVMDKTKQRVQSLVAALLGAVLVGLVVFVSAEAKDLVVDDGVVKGCRLPDVEGAMTVFVMEDGQLKCWRWR